MGMARGTCEVCGGELDFLGECDACNETAQVEVARRVAELTRQEYASALETVKIDFPSVREAFKAIRDRFRGVEYSDVREAWNRATALEEERRCEYRNEVNMENKYNNYREELVYYQ